MLATLSSAIAVLAAVAAVYVASKWPGPLDPVHWEDVPPLRELHGPYASNELLMNAELLHEGEVLGPEAFALGKDGTIYTGLADGRVISLDPKGKSLQNVFFVGGAIAARKEAQALQSSAQARHAKQGASDNLGNGLNDAALMQKCTQALRQKGHRGLGEEGEAQCGRPLGLEMSADKQQLYILDAYHGLFTLQLSSGAAKHVLNAATAVPQAFSSRHEGVPPHSDASKPVKFLNDLALVGDGSVLITDSSWKHSRYWNRLEILDGAPRGRLLHFDPATAVLSTLLCGLHFPNGIELSDDGTRARIMESMRFRLLEVDLQAYSSSSSSSSNSGEGVASSGGAAAAAVSDCSGTALPPHVKVLAAGLPGFCDNIARDESTAARREAGTALVGCGTKVAKPFSLLHAQFKLPLWLRRAIGALVPMDVIERLVPRYGLVLQLDRERAVETSYHDPSGRVAYISAALHHPDSKYLFLGSSQNAYLARVRLP